jgi:hypothetical protein
MSADLFAEFGETSSQKQEQKPQASTQQAPFSFFDDLSGLNTAPAAQSQSQSQTQPQPQVQPHIPAQAAENDDDWGDFEGPADPAPVKQDAFSFPAQQQPAVQQQPQSHTGWQPAPVFKAKKSYDSNVLFDAEEDAGDEDDFGDFEGTMSSGVSAPPPAPAPSSAGLADLLGDLDLTQPKPQSREREAERRAVKHAPSRSVTSTQAFGFGPIRQTPRPASIMTPPSAAKEETWDSFDDWEASIPTKTSKKPKETLPSRKQQSTPAPTDTPSSLDDPLPGELPPTNVPPPGLLLSLFPPLFAEASEKLFRPMASQTQPMRNRLLSEPATIAYLQGYLALASVAARIIAGRKLRWKRDVHLSQGMRIGPASSRATSGMKLTGIDKSENLKEEREVSDVVRAWKEQVGRLRHVVAAANQAKAGSLGTVPDLQETMPVRALKQSEGGIPARLPCMLCGLKRDERVASADVAVDDSFGEWWVEQVSMHRGQYSHSKPSLCFVLCQC